MLPVYACVVLTFAGEMAHLHGLVGIKLTMMHGKLHNIANRVLGGLWPASHISHAPNILNLVLASYSAWSKICGSHMLFLLPHFIIYSCSTSIQVSCLK